MPSKRAALPTPTITQAEDGTWGLEVPGVASTAGHPAPEWALAKAVEAVRRAAADIVRSWIAGRPVTPAQQEVVLLVTRGDSQVYAWLEAGLVEDPKRR
ncbi:hypothetical protein P5P86_06445 [Nocardioides sp. BP30]|uniref:hypothetical protein n=1 Tax=Nocardioides sp. BP30 TaxID=3036374 RepID=UPI0024687FDC|nr:hypothetical protein [Nocardioides sp. BP30]WGL53467.1 hypothetical protein P5P86_06445 [Nocardioides sp. BP30]